MRKKISCFVLTLLLVCGIFPSSAFAQNSEVDLSGEFNTLLPQAFANGFAEKIVLVNGEECTISAKLENLDENGNVTGLTTTEVIERKQTKGDGLGFYMYKATAGAKRLTYSFAGFNGRMDLYTDFTISNGLTTFTDVSNGVYAVPFTTSYVVSKDNYIETETYRSFTSHGTVSFGVAGQVPVSVTMEAFFYLDYPVAGDWNLVNYTVNVTGTAN